MITKVFRVEKKVIDSLLKDQELNRKVELKHFSGSLFGIDGEVLIVRIPENVEEKIEIPGEELDKKTAQEILTKIKEFEENAAMGVGLIFQ